MPNAFRTQTVHLGNTGNPDTFNQPSLYLPGQLGLSFDYGDRTYTFVQLDPGATTPVVGQLMYWMNKASGAAEVTNVIANAIGGAAASARNQVAGIIRNVATPGNYIAMLIQGSLIPIQVGSATPAVGDLVMANTTAGNAINAASGVAPTFNVLGVFRSTATANVATADINIESLA